MSRAMSGGLALALAVASWSPMAAAAMPSADEPAAIAILGAMQPADDPAATVTPAAPQPVDDPAATTAPVDSPGAADEAPVVESPSPDDAVVVGPAVAGEPTGPEPVVGTDPPAEASPDPSPSASPSPDTHDVPADDYESESGLAPGGYYGHGVILDRAPPDGHQQIVLGSILVPLGIIAAVSSGVGTWMSVPSHCAERMAAIGTEIEDPSRCQGWFVYNAINTTYGVLMLTSGAAILGIGLVKRQRYRAWRAKHGMRAWIQPGRRNAAVGLTLRF